MSCVLYSDYINKKTPVFLGKSAGKWVVVRDANRAFEFNSDTAATNTASCVLPETLKGYKWQPVLKSSLDLLTQQDTQGGSGTDDLTHRLREVGLDFMQFRAGSQEIDNMSSLEFADFIGSSCDRVMDSIVLAKGAYNFLEEQMNKLESIVSQADLELCDIYHYIEINKIDAIKRQKVFGVLERVLHKRRRAKLALSKLKRMTSTCTFLVGANIRGTVKETYTPRTDVWKELENL